MEERRTPCSSPAKLRSGLPPSVQMPNVTNVASKYCQCQACQQRKAALSSSALQIDNKESNLTKLEKEFDDFFKRNQLATQSQPCCSHQCKKLQGPSSRLNVPKLNVNNQQLAEMKNKLKPQNFRKLGLTGGYNIWSNVFNNGVVHFITEIIFILVIVIVATMAVWIAFFKFMYRIAKMLHESRSKHIKTMVLVLVGILLVSIVSGVVRDRYKDMQLKKPKMHKKSQSVILPSWKHEAKADSHWFKLPNWGVAQKPCSNNFIYSLWGRNREVPKRSYKFWQSSIAHRKKYEFKIYNPFSRPPPTRTFKERATNIIFFWQTAKPPKRNWLGIIIYQNQHPKPQKSNSWSSMFHLSKKVEKKGWFLQKRSDFGIYWTSCLQSSKLRWRKFYRRLQEAHRKRNWQKSCGCKSSYYFWTKPCSVHKLNEEKRNCPICRLKTASKSEQDRVADLIKARKRAKLYTIPLDMKTPPPLLTYLYNELFNSP